MSCRPLSFARGYHVCPSGPDVASRSRLDIGWRWPTQARWGDPHPAEAADLERRTAAARAWLDAYAPEKARLVVQERLPAEVKELGEDQRLYLGALAIAAEKAGVATDATARTGEAWQARIFEVAGAAAIPTGRAFGALYVAFLDRINGPRAGWLLSSLDQAFVVHRLREAAGWQDAPAA